MAHMKRGRGPLKHLPFGEVDTRALAFTRRSSTRSSVPAYAASGIDTFMLSGDLGVLLQLYPSSVRQTGVTTNVVYGVYLNVPDVPNVAFSSG